MTEAAERSTGLGAAMLTHLFGLVREAGCAKLPLDTPVTDMRDHGFYERQELAAGALYFSIAITR